MTAGWPASESGRGRSLSVCNALCAAAGPVGRRPKYLKGYFDQERKWRSRLLARDAARRKVQKQETSFETYPFIGEPPGGGPGTEAAECRDLGTAIIRSPPLQF